MKSYHCPNDLEKFGFQCLTGEACGLSMRLLYDVNELGRKVLCKVLGIPDISLPSPWNGRRFAAGSVMLTGELALTCAIFGMLETGCLEVWQCYDKSGRLTSEIYGLETQEEIEQAKQWNIGHPREDRWYRWTYGGTARDRNVHVMTGRIG